MKKSSLIALLDMMDGHPITEPDAIKAELVAEINRGAAEKEARDAAYESIHSLVVDNLTDTPVTVAELYREIGEEVEAHGLNKPKVQYALNSLWQDEILKVPGKPNKYARKH